MSCCSPWFLASSRSLLRTLYCIQTLTLTVKRWVRHRDRRYRPLSQPVSLMTISQSLGPWQELHKQLIILRYIPPAKLESGDQCLRAERSRCRTHLNVNYAVSVKHLPHMSTWILPLSVVSLLTSESTPSLSPSHPSSVGTSRARTILEACPNL